MAATYSGRLWQGRAVARARRTGAGDSRKRAISASSERCGRCPRAVCGGVDDLRFSGAKNGGSTSSAAPISAEYSWPTTVATREPNEWPTTIAGPASNAPASRAVSTASRAKVGKS